jgi:hypothetical protein
MEYLYLINNIYKMKKTAIFVFILFIAIGFSVNSQIAVGYLTDGNTLSLSSNPSHILWGEFRVNTKSYNQSDWSYSDRGITQVYMLSNIFSSGKASLYAGLGFGANLLSKGNDIWISVNIPVGLKMNPFASLPDLYLFGEYTPMIITNEGPPVIHCMSVGFRYILSKKE